MAVHELGHVMGALFTNGSVTKVVLHPLSISRTDVLPNPQPAIVVWLGPIVGALLPLLISYLPLGDPTIKHISKFFAGFCLVANGAYIAVGSFEGIGDCGEMLRTGTPTWLMLAFGGVAIPMGFYVWHRMGSARDFFAEPTLVTTKMLWVTTAVLAVVVVSELVVSELVVTR